MGAACRQAAPGQRLCRQILDALLHCHRLSARQCGFERFYRRGGARSGRARARCQGALPHRSTKSLSEKFMLNAKHGGWNEARAKAALQLIAGLFDGPVELSEMRG